MALSSIRGEKFLVLSEGSTEEMKGFRQIFILEREKTSGWWQFMELIFEVQGVELVEPEWLKGKGRLMVRQENVEDWKKCSAPRSFSVSCPCCGEEMEVRVSRKGKETAAAVLKQLVQNSHPVGQERSVPIAGTGFMENGEVGGHFGFTRIQNRSVRDGPRPDQNVGGSRCFGRYELKANEPIG